MSAKNRCAIYCPSCDVSVGRQRWSEHESGILHIENEKQQEQLSADRRKSPSVRQKTLPVFQPPPPTSLEHHVLSFISQIRYEPQECHEIQQSILEDLKAALSETFGKCRFSFYGSMTVGLAFVSSDLDIYVDVDRFVYDLRSLNEKHEAMSKVFRCANALYDDENFTEIEPIFEAQVPIVKLVHVPSKISCDISFSKMGVESSRLVNFYLGRHRKFLEVMMLIKYWAKKNNICSGLRSISSYSWTLLFISYLQTRTLPNGERLLPSLLEVQRKGGKGELINGCRVDCEMANASPLKLPACPAFSHRGLLEGFFHYYEDFKFGESIVSPFLGQPIHCASATAQKRTRTMDPEGLAYVRCYDEWTKKDGMYVKIIQDPFVHGKLVMCQRSMLPYVKSCLAKASQICRTEESPVLLGRLFLTTSSISNGFAIRASESNGRTICVGKRTRPRARPKKNFKKATASPTIQEIATEVAVPPQAIFNGEICEDGFFVPLNHVPIPKAIDAILDVLSKLMMFDVKPIAQNESLDAPSNGVVARHKFLCVPLCPVPWILLKKIGLDTLVPDLHSKSVLAFRKEYFRTLNRRFVSRPSEIRQFVCEITKTSTASVLKITFKPRFVDSTGFSTHVMNFLRTSMLKWILIVFSSL